MGGSIVIGVNIGGGYMSFFGVYFIELEELCRELISFVSLFNESNDDGFV